MRIQARWTQISNIVFLSLFRVLLQLMSSCLCIDYIGEEYITMQVVRKGSEDHNCGSSTWEVGGNAGNRSHFGRPNAQYGLFKTCPGADNNAVISIFSLA